MLIHQIKEWYFHHKYLCFILLFLSLIVMYSLQNRSSPPEQIHSTQLSIANGNEVLLLYVFANTHSHALENLKYFVENTVRQGDGVDYYFIVQKIENKILTENDLPKLNSTDAHYIDHKNECFDFGTFGWFINEFTYGNPWTKDKPSSKKTIHLKKYKYFLFLNSSIRGPFFTPYFIQLVLQAHKNYYWYSIFTRRINDKVKLVGCTISCENTPHVQTYIFATDFTGFTLLLKPGTSGTTSEKGIFGCYSTKDDVSINSELASSNRMLESGYFIDSLLTKYQKVNFSSFSNRFCNANMNPYKDKGLEGTSLEPYEVVFVKYNDLEFMKEARDKAKLYQKWQTDIQKVNRSMW